MGVIQQQSSKATTYIYIGVLVGFFNSALLFPHYLDASEKGILDSITTICLIASGIFSLGAPLVTIRLFPFFRDVSKNHNGYLSFLFGVVFLGLIIGLIPLYYFYRSEFPQAFQASFYLALIIIVYFFRLIFQNIDPFVRMQYNSVLGVVSSSFLLKLVSLVGIVLYAFNLIDLKGLILTHALALSFPGIISLIYLVYSHEFKLKWELFTLKVREESLKKEIYKTAFFGFLGASGSVFLIEVDKMILLDLMSEREVGIYTTAAFFGIMVNVPARAIRGIASVVIADSWKSNNLENIKDVYQKSTLNLQVVSSYLFIGIVLCSKYVFEFMKPEYSEGLGVVVCIAFAQWVDAVTSVNTDVLSTSKYYRYQTFFMSTMIILVVGLNYWFIPIYGIEGAAISTMISLIVINVVRTLFIYSKTKIHPFQKVNFKIFLVSISIILSAYYFDTINIENSLLHLFSTGTFITLSYWSIILYFKLSPEIIEIVRKKIIK